MTIEQLTHKCSSCDAITLHSMREPFVPTVLVETEYGVEKEDGAQICMLACLSCESISLWVMRDNFTLKNALSPNQKLKISPDYWIYRQQFKAPPLEFSHHMNGALSETMSHRWNELQQCLSVGAYLSATVLIGSILEGLLFATCSNNPQAFTSPVAPKQRGTTQVKSLTEWTLAEMLAVAGDLKWLSGQTNKFAGSVREYRNYIHPLAHARNLTTEVITEGTCSISFAVLVDALLQLKPLLPLVK